MSRTSPASSGVQTDVPPMLEMRGITKRFPGVIANDNVSFDVRPGEVHTLLGENGAGKSTLMKILYGLYQPEAGSVFLNGEPVQLQSPSDAITHRIGMIHQHFMLVSSLSVAENVALGLRSSRGPVTDLRQVSKKIRILSDRYGLQVDPDSYIWQLAVGERQRVEIIKALYRDVQLLVLDEPTAVLTPQEVDDFFIILREMTSDGRGLIFISHKLNEVMQLSDRISVLRSGKLVGTTTPAQTTRQDLAQMMVGREVLSHREERPAAQTKVALRIENLQVGGDRGVDALVDFNLDVRAGEILGVAGVSGNGQRELAEAITGLRPVKNVVPEERMRDGAIGEFSVADNLVLHNHHSPKFSRAGFLNFNAIRAHCTKLVADFRVITPTIDTPAKNLSGGNIQKFIIARELDSEPGVLIAAQPTRGVDIGAAEYIHSRLLAARNAGTAIMVISEDLDEVMLLADRIAVICQGSMMGVIDRAAASREKLGLMMAGVVNDE